MGQVGGGVCVGIYNTLTPKASVPIVAIVRLGVNHTYTKECGQSAICATVSGLWDRQNRFVERC